MRTREEIIKEIEYQQRLLNSLVNAKDYQRELEIRNIIQGLVWSLGTDYLSKEEEEYVINDKVQSEIILLQTYVINDKVQSDILLLQTQLNSANDTAKFYKTVLGSYVDAYQDLKKRYEDLKRGAENKYYDTDKLMNIKGNKFIIVPKCNCKQLLNQLYGVNKTLKYYINGEAVCVGDVIKIYTDKRISETGVVKEININHLILIDDGGRDTVILFSAINKVHNYNRRE